MITTIWELIRNRFFAVLNNSLRCRRLFLAYCLGCCLGFCGYWFSRYSPGFTFGGPGDFTTFYTGALIVRSGQPEHLYDLVTQAHFQKQLLLPYGWVFKDGLLPYMYPPFLAILVIPFTYLPLQLAFHAWNLLSILILFLSIKMLCMHLAPRIPGRFAFCIVGALAFFPVFETLYKGQASFFILLFFTMIYIQMDSGREKLAGVALGLALLKPQLVLTITLLALLQKRWRMLISFSVTAVILLVCSLILVKSEGIHAYWNLSGAAMRWNGPFNFVPALMPNIRGTIYRLDFLLSAFDVSRASTQFLMIVTGALTVLSFILFIFLFRIPRVPSRSNEVSSIFLRLQTV